MRKFSRLITFMSGLMLVTMVLALVPLPVSADTVPPSVSTKNASDVSSTGATLNGKLDFLGTASSVDVSFEWGTTSGSYPNETTAEAMSATGAFSFDLSGLDPNTSYYFRVKAVGDGTSYGAEEDFTTGTTPPSATTNDASDITTTGVTLNGKLDFLGAATSVDVTFEWGTSPGSYSDETTAETMSTTEAFSFDLSGLNPSTSYYFRVKAVGDGTSYGAEEDFTTDLPQPSVSTNDATGVGTTSATLNMSYDFKDYGSGSVNFAYKPDGGSWAYTGVVAKSGSGSYLEAISDLSSGTTYYFKAQITYDSTTIDGAEKQFTTSKVTPTVTTNDASDITTTGATLNGKLDFLGTASSVDVSFEWGTTSGSYPNETTAEAMSATGAFSFDLSGLDPNTTYYFRVKAVGDAISYGGEKSFTTGTTPPSATTNDASDITTTGVTLNGSLTSLGTATSVDVTFEWGTTSGALGDETTAEAMSATGAFSFDLSGLNPDTSYYFRAKAVGDGTSHGGERGFTTTEDEERGGEAGGGGAPGYWVVIIDNLGKITEARVSPSGELLESVRATDAEGQIALELERGTKILCPDGKVPQRLEMKTIQILPPEDMVILGQVYRLDAYLYEYSPNPSLFTISPPGKLTLSYDLSELPLNSLAVFAAYYDTQKGWVEFPSADITEAGKLTTEISGSLFFTIMVKLGPPPSPAEPAEPCFRPSNLVIEPGEAKPGQEITINLIITNIGGAAGTCTLELKVDGVVRSVKSVTLEPGESEVVSFSITEDMEGKHIVEIADLKGDFSIVIISRPWWLLSTAAIPPVIISLERRRRWKQRVEWSIGLKTKDWLVK
ncbi:MAG: hypothetical protein KAV98_02270 [Dehalococcoidia bacterium]|nr:hypothetical protein [Dehalococcoidia bacterium]